MKQILGLDLGVGSIGWAAIQVDETDKYAVKQIVGMGSRIVPLSTDDSNEFSTGRAISKNMARTAKRTSRKGLDRYQLRRTYLLRLLESLGMKPDEPLWKYPMLQLWELRADAATPGKQLSLQQLGRVLCHLNQRRGYKLSKSDETDDKKQTEYVQAVNNRYQEIKERNLTIGQFFYQNLKDSEKRNNSDSVYYTYRIKEKVFPRQAYIEEYDTIMAIQKEFYPEILTDAIIKKLRDEVIFYQRPLKSCKHLVSLCEQEKRQYPNQDGKLVWSGPKVAPKTSPLFQVCKIWESLNNLSVANRKTHENRVPSIEEKTMFFQYLDNNPKGVSKKTTKNLAGKPTESIKLSPAIERLFEIMGLKQEDGWYVSENVEKILQENTTKLALRKALTGLKQEKIDYLLSFNLHEKESSVVNTETGEILPIISEDFENEPLYRLWHLIYSCQEKKDLENSLKKHFGIENEEVCNNLYKLDFVKHGYGNKSSKNMRRILPYLTRGKKYSESCEEAGFNHSNSKTKEENLERELLSVLPLLPKNSLRQPIVEKILNQMINVVNQVQATYGMTDEIHVELARELKQSREERSETSRRIAENERENKRISELIREYGLYPTRSRIEKFKLWEESEHKCFYCGEPIGVKEFLSGFDAEIEHIIPRSLFFDNGFSNKVCACRKCNAEKGNKTAYDFMSTRPEEKFNAYLNRVEDYAKDKRISRTKRNYLLMPQGKIPQDFIERQLRLSQYISRKAVEILSQTCHDVLPTGGSITATARKLWGYNDILHNLNFERFKAAGLTETFEVERDGQKSLKERIVDWDKRSDHRHHAIDALVIALTRRSMVQRINTLSSSRDTLYGDIQRKEEEWKNKLSLLEEWISEQPHFSVSDVSKQVAQIFVSFKAGKRVATTGKRYIYKNGKRKVAQKGILIPRGALSEESVYGQIRTLVTNKPLKELFANPDSIVKPYIKRLIDDRLAQNGNDAKKALASIKKHPIMIHDGKEELKYASCYEEAYVIRYPIESIVDKKASTEEKVKKALDFVVDKKIRDLMFQRIKECGFNVVEAFKEPLYFDKDKTIPIKTVRCFTGLNAVEPVRFNSEGEPEAFVKPGNNHHVAIYEDAEGNLQEHVVTFWHANERKKLGIPVVITSPYDVWERLQKQSDLNDFIWAKLPKRDWKLKFSMQQNEMFVLGMEEESYQDAIRKKDYKALGRHLYRVQKIATHLYQFRYHTETSVANDTTQTMQAGCFHRIQSFSALTKLNPHKVRINSIGQITDIQ